MKDVMFFHDFSVMSPFTMRLDLAFSPLLATPFQLIENLSISPVLLKQLKFLIPHSIHFTMQKSSSKIFDFDIFTACFLKARSCTWT